MTSQASFLQFALVILYPLIGAAGLALWGVERIAHTVQARGKALRAAYIVLLGLCVFPLSFFLFAAFTEACYGQGSGLYNQAHQAQCGSELVLGVPWWGVVLYTVDILALAWSVIRSVKHWRGFSWKMALPFVYFFIIRLLLLTLLGRIENAPPFS
jgi:hypothetical protein